jgi:hypothetical protein
MEEAEEAIRNIANKRNIFGLENRRKSSFLFYLSFIL